MGPWKDIEKTAKGGVMNPKPYSAKRCCAFHTVIVLSCLLCISGCVKSGDETALQVEAIKQELAQIRQLLDEARTDRDTLKAQLTTVSESAAADRLQIDQLVQRLEEAVVDRQKLDAMTQQRDAAVAELNEAHAVIEKLQNELTGLAERAAEIENANAQLQQQLDSSKQASQADNSKANSAKVGFPVIEGFKQ